MKQFLNLSSLIDFYQNKQLLVFGYGSLMWNPDFEYQFSSAFTVRGFYRDFCIYSTHYRGTEENPGLVLGLRQGEKNCTGKLFVVAENKKEEVLSRLWEREMIGDVYLPTILLKKNYETDLGESKILTFVANIQSAKFCRLPKEKKLEIIQSARGKEGACIDYVKNTQKELQKLKIYDPAVENLLD